MGNRLDSLATPPILATHGVTCACRACASSSYQELLSTADYQRHEITRLTSELKAARHALACERYRRLTLVIAQAVAAGDRSAWAAAVAERMQLGVSDVDAAGMTRPACDHFFEVLSVNGRNLDGAVRKCALCGEVK